MAIAFAERGMFTGALLRYRQRRMRERTVGASSVHRAERTERDPRPYGAFQWPTSIFITGPFEEDPRAPSTLKEAWLIEKLYGPPQRWTLSIVPLDSLRSEQPDPGQRLETGTVNGIAVALLSSKSVPWLSVELVGDAVRIYEVDG